MTLFQLQVTSAYAPTNRHIVECLNQLHVQMDSERLELQEQ